MIQVFPGSLWPHIEERRGWAGVVPERPVRDYCRVRLRDSGGQDGGTGRGGTETWLGLFPPWSL